MTAVEAALKRLEAAIAGRDGPDHDHGSDGLSHVAAQDVVIISAGLTDPQCVVLHDGAKKALSGRPADSEPLPLMQKTWQVRHLIAKAKPDAE